jgi:hypothetical protein
MSFKTKPKATFDSKPPAKQRPLERLLPPDLTFRGEKDEELDSLKWLSSGMRRRRPKHIEKPRNAD